MKIELTIKSARFKEFSEEDKESQKKLEEERKIRKIIGQDEEDEQESLFGAMKNLPIEFTYRPYIIDSYDIMGFTPYDDTHTILLTDGHGDLVIKMDYQSWKDVYQTVTGQTIRTIESYITPKSEKRK